MDITNKELPDRIESRIADVDYNKDLTQRRVALEFVYGDRPFYNKTKMHAALGSEVSPETVLSRMDELVERDVLRRDEMNNGGLYWLKHPDSEWPIPPDVEVNAKRTEPTVTEWRRQSHVRVAAFSVLLAVLGTAATIVGVFQSGGYYQLPIEASDLIAYGLSAGIFSYLGFLFAGLIWFLDLPEVEDLSVIADE